MLISNLRKSISHRLVGRTNPLYPNDPLKEPPKEPMKFPSQLPVLSQEGLILLVLILGNSIMRTNLHVHSKKTECLDAWPLYFSWILRSLIHRTLSNWFINFESWHGSYCKRLFNSLISWRNNCNFTKSYKNGFGIEVSKFMKAHSYDTNFHWYLFTIQPSKFTVLLDLQLWMLLIKRTDQILLWGGDKQGNLGIFWKLMCSWKY